MITVNQLGYRPSDQKIAVGSVVGGSDFRVIDDQGNEVYKGTFSKTEKNAMSGQEECTGDFSALTKPGTYAVVGQDGEKSFTFDINENVYDKGMESMITFFYLQRCGMELPEIKAGVYAHSSCHMGKARVYGTDKQIDVSGGWHDAGDYGRYVGPGAMTVILLLLAYEKNPDEKNILEEVRYEIDWMLKMQKEDGMLYHKVSCANFCDFIMPQEEQEELIISPESVTATADFAAALAMAATVFRKSDADYAMRLEQASRKAYDAMKKAEQPGGFHNPEGIVTGEYGDECDIDERYMAAAVLFKEFGDATYHNDFKQLAGQGILHGYGWEEMGSFGNLMYLKLDETKRDQTIYEKILIDVLSLADNILALSESDTYGLGMRSFKWGSNLYVAQCGSHLMTAYHLTGNKRYYRAAKQHLDYIFGNNPLSMCYLTGSGTKAPQNPHHRPSEAVGEAMPGMVVGGPDQYLHDETAVKFLKGQAPAKCYIDELESYSTNEMTIYWNAAVIYLLADVLNG